MNIFCRKKILFVYFSIGDFCYTPLDIGYILAQMKGNGVKGYNFKIEEYRRDFLNGKEAEKTEKEIIKSRIDSFLAQDPHAIFFFLDSVLWAKTFALNMAKKIAIEIKKMHPEIFLGVQSYKFNEYLIKKAFSCRSLDCVIGDEPEDAFLKIEKILRYERVEKVFYHNDARNSDNFFGFFRRNTKVVDKNLDYIHSPYISHIFDSFLSNKQVEYKNNFTAFIYSARGCQFGCYYCARSIKYEKVSFFSAGRFYDEVEYIVKNFKIFHFFVLDDAFLFSKKRLEDFLFEFGKRKKKNPLLKNIGLFIMARAESLDKDVIQILKNINVIWIQIGLQTINPNLQHYMNRNISMDNFARAVSMLKKIKIKTFIDIISGLPYDTLEYFKKTVDFAVSLEPEAVQIKQFYFCPGTLFYLKRKEYGIETTVIKDDFNLPYVIKTIGLVNVKYHREVDKYLDYIIKEHPEISWKIVTELKYLKSKLDFFVKK